MAYQQENLNLHDFSLTVDEVAGLSRLTPTCRGEWFMGAFMVKVLFEGTPTQTKGTEM